MYRFSTAATYEKGQRKKRIYRKNIRYKYYIQYLIFCTKIYSILSSYTNIYSKRRLEIWKIGLDLNTIDR